jgi:hypothetical protein
LVKKQTLESLQQAAADGKRVAEDAKKKADDYNERAKSARKDYEAKYKNTQ